VANAHRSRWPSILRKFFSLSSQAEATQRSTISRSRHRVTFAVRRATPLCGLSITLVVARHLYGEGGAARRTSRRGSTSCAFEAVLGEVSEWIVGHSENAPLRPRAREVRFEEVDPTFARTPFRGTC
jgi:hypothetical protein